MSRSIEFRAFDHDTKQFVSEFDVLPDGRVWSQEGGHEFKNISLQQFTGLYDIKDMAVFEGDIFLRDGLYWVVQWVAEDAGFWFVEPRDQGRLNIGMNCTEGEVVGNIYENPDIIPPTGNLRML